MDKADRSETSPVTTRIRQRWRTSWSKGNVGHDRLDEIFLVALVLKLLGNHVQGLPHFGEEHNRLQKELNGLGHRFLFWMAQLVWGTMRVMHSQILIEVDGIKN